ncbi:MAG: hypothetical protein U0586_05820 [Candidatus Brocadiaceae bacterium]
MANVAGEARIIILKLEVLTMNAIKGIYHNEVIEDSEMQKTSGVLVIFPEKKVPIF